MATADHYTTGGAFGRPANLSPLEERAAALGVTPLDVLLAERREKVRQIARIMRERIAPNKKITGNLDADRRRARGKAMVLMRADGTLGPATTAEDIASTHPTFEYWCDTVALANAELVLAGADVKELEDEVQAINDRLLRTRDLLKMHSAEAHLEPAGA